MTFNRRRWSVAAALVSAAFVLSACAGNSGPSVPAAPIQNSSSLFAPLGGQPALSAFGAHSDATTCPKKYLDCFTYSLKKGLKVNWCYGPTSDACKDTKDYKWSGIVCDAKGATCKKPIEQLTAKWTGPFKCTKKTNCPGMSKGFYELDTITKGKTPPKITTKYAYKQDIHICAGTSCQDVYIGINVSK